MILTARQLEDLHRQSGGNGQLTLPYRARLTPLATDWVRAKRIVLGYSNVEAPTSAAPASADAQPLDPEERRRTAASPTPPLAIAGASSAAILWWCDGPCGPAKAALAAQAKESNLRPIDKPADLKQLVPVIKAIACELKSSRASGAILMVQNGAQATVLANRCPSLRAVLGTCMDAVEQGMRLVAANVLIVEYPYKTLPQVRNLLSRFTRGPRVLGEEVQRQLQELASCG